MRSDTRRIRGATRPTNAESARSHPASVGSITTSGNKEDFVSMGMTDTLKLHTMVENTRTILAIKIITATCGLGCLSPLRSSPIIESVGDRLRQFIPVWKQDQPFSDQIKAVAAWIASEGPLTQADRRRPSVIACTRIDGHPGQLRGGRTAVHISGRRRTSFLTSGYKLGQPSSKSAAGYSFAIGRASIASSRASNDPGRECL